MDWLKEIDERMDGTKAGVWTQKSMREFREHAPTDIAKLIAAVRYVLDEMALLQRVTGQARNFPIEYEAFVQRVARAVTSKLQSGEFEVKA